MKKNVFGFMMRLYFHVALAADKGNALETCFKRPQDSAFMSETTVQVL